jgi:tetratricopeptide (TPR) repeat protein
MINHGLENLALNLIDTIRQVLSDSTTLALERGVILEKQNSYQQAVLEFFAALSDSGKAAIKAEKRLLALLHYPESSEDAEQTLLAQTEKDINARAVKILSSHYLKEEQFAQAFDFAVLRDSLEDGTGASLMEFMRGCMERKLYQQASRMAQYILSRYDNAPFTGGTYFLYAEVLDQLGRFDESIAVYDTIIATFPRQQDKAGALYRIGDIYLNRLNDPARALAVFDSVITNYDAGVGYLFAKLGIPYCHLREGQLDQARADFEDILQLRLNEDMREQVEHNLALILFFEKKFDSSRVALRKLLVDYPRGFFVNDAVQLLLLLDEVEDASPLLYEFSNALLFEQRRMLDSTAAKLLVIAHDPNRALADVALFKLAVLSLERSDSVSALEYIDQLAADFPESYYLPFGLKTKADVYMTKPEQIEEAKSIYRHLLENSPNYPFVSDVRKKMRQLEGEA